MQETRHQFRESLKELEGETLEGLEMVIQQLDRALESVSHHDVELAGIVIADDDRVDRRYLEIHQGVLSLLARQAPVAGDLRIVAALLHIIRCVERMGDQCVNIAKLVRLSGYEAAKDNEILDTIERMGQLSRSQASQANEAFATRNVTIAQDLVGLDGEIERLNRAIFNRAVDIGDDLEVREWAMFMILVALPGADRGQHRRHRGADGIRRDRAVPRVRGRTATRVERKPRAIACFRGGSP